MTTHREIAHRMKKGTYLFDDCPRCEEHSKTLYDLDTATLMWLAEMSEIAHKPDRNSFDLSMNERRAITKLRLYARITFRSGITQEAAS